MMVTQRQAPHSNLFARMVEMLRTVYRFAGRIVLGGLAIMAAGVGALTMAVLGVLIALAAVIARLMRGVRAPVRRPAYNARNTSSDGASEEGVVLEARNTDHGWTVE